MLQVEGGRREQGQLQQLVLLFTADAVIGVVALDGAAAADGFIDMHGVLLGVAKLKVRHPKQPTRPLPTLINDVTHQKIRMPV
ncbi:hypothetical protein D3C77_599600 [compost metagenome]